LSPIERTLGRKCMTEGPLYRNECPLTEGTRLSTYMANPHDERPARQFDIRIERYTQQSVPAESEMEVYDGGGESPSQDTANPYDEPAAAQSPDSVDNLQ